MSSPFATEPDDKAHIQNLEWFNQRLREDNLALRRRIYRLTHPVPAWKRAFVKIVARIMRLR